MPASAQPAAPGRKRLRATAAGEVDELGNVVWAFPAHSGFGRLSRVEPGQARI